MLFLPLRVRVVFGLIISVSGLNVLGSRRVANLFCRVQAGRQVDFKGSNPKFH